MTHSVRIGDRWIGEEHPVYVIAEAGLNHGGDLELAVGMVEAAAKAGADAIKFQAFDTDERFGDDEPTKALVRPAEFGERHFRTLAAVAQRHGIHFFSTAFEPGKVAMLTGLGVPAIKVASCDIGNVPLLRSIAGAGLPVVMSRGTGTKDDIDGALAIFAARKVPVVLLHCVSSYPLKDEDANLRAIHSLRRLYDVPVGFSDHTPGIDVAVASVYAGACAVEKHYTLDRARRGIDWEISVDPAELATLVAGIRRAETVLGHGRIEPLPCEDEEVRYRAGLRTAGH